MVDRSAFTSPIFWIALAVHGVLAIAAVSSPEMLFREDMLACYAVALAAIFIVFAVSILQFTSTLDGKLVLISLGLHVPIMILVYAGIYSGRGLISDGTLLYPDFATAAYVSIVTITTLVSDAFV